MDFGPRDFRAVLGRFATGVSVVTTALDEERAGITVNAFASLSLEPPLVLICLDTASFVHALVKRSGVFAVNILSEWQADIAQCFAGRSEYRYKEFCGVLTHSEATGAPVFNEALGWIDCRVTAIYPGGDHSIFVGHVQALGSSSDDAPLLYYRGAYPRMEPMDPITRDE